jgi:hypothetical protein
MYNSDYAHCHRWVPIHVQIAGVVIILRCKPYRHVYVLLFTNTYFVIDYVYFEAQQQQQQQQQQQSMHHQQQQPFQIRRIEELNKTAGGNVEAKVMCFYRRRDLPAQLVALADKHQQHQQQQQLSLTLSLSPGGSSAIKGSGKQSSTIKSSSASDKDASTDKKEQDTSASGALPMVKKEQQNEEQSVSKIETSEINESVKEEQQQQQDVEMSEDLETNSSVSAVVKSGEVRADGDEAETNDKCKYIQYCLFILFYLR